MKDWELILNKGKKRVYKLNFKVRRFKRPGGGLSTILGEGLNEKS